MTGPLFEQLESRLLLSVSIQPGENPMQPGLIPAVTPDPIQVGTGPDPDSVPPDWLTPEKVRKTYGIEGLTFGSVQGDGRGQTIAIVDAFKVPSVSSDLAGFDSYFGIPSGPGLTVLNQSGNPGPLPRTPDHPEDDPRWAYEAPLDVEWVHAIAPGANILLVEADSADEWNMLQALKTAVDQTTTDLYGLPRGGKGDTARFPF